MRKTTKKVFKLLYENDSKFESYRVIATDNYLEVKIYFKLNAYYNGQKIMESVWIKRESDLISPGIFVEGIRNTINEVYYN